MIVARAQVESLFRLSDGRLILVISRTDFMRSLPSGVYDIWINDRDKFEVRLDTELVQPTNHLRFSMSTRNAHLQAHLKQGDLVTIDVSERSPQEGAL